MSKWLNNTKRIWGTDNIEKPCHELGYCPYGQLVEEFPMHEEAKKHAIENNMYVKFIKGKGWVSCDKDDESATPDLNWAVGRVKEEYSCRAFGHDCPVFYHGEFISEGKIDDR